MVHYGILYYAGHLTADPCHLGFQPAAQYACPEPDSAYPVQEVSGLHDCTTVN